MKKALLLLLCSCVCSFAGVKISGDGTEIVVGNKPSYVAEFAANELSQFLGRALGKEIAVKASSEAPVRIYVGLKPDGQAEKQKTYDSHIIAGNDGAVYIYGYDTPVDKKPSMYELLQNVDSRGTIEAVYTFLEDYAGVRWIEPGKEGEIVPRLDAIELPEMSRTLSPSFTERRTYYLRQLGNVWYFGRAEDEPEYGSTEEFLLWGLRLRYTAFTARVMGCHTPSYIHLDRDLFPVCPQMFALQPDGSRSTKDLCWSCKETKDFWWNIVDAYFRGDPNPHAVGIKDDAWNENLFILKDEFMIDPHDYGKDFFCTCPECKAVVEKYGENGFGELIFSTIAEVARKVEDKYPGNYITTLVYPPKRMFPETVKLPKNLKVRMTVGDKALCSDTSVADGELELMKKWKQEQGNKVALWMYLMSVHGNRLYGVPEIASVNFIDFLRKAAPYADGVFYEHIEPNHTVRNLDMYLIAHALWNKDMDVDAWRREFMRLAFGAAADDVLAFYNRLEHNWDEVMKLQMAHPEELKLDIAYKIRKRVFNTIYTYDEIMALQKMLDAAKAKVPKGSPEAKRIARYDKYLMEITRKEFSVYTDDKAHSFMQQDVLCTLKVAGEPGEDDWKAVPRLEMVSAKSGVVPQAKSFIRVMSSDDAFHLRCEFDEPLMEESRTKKDGNKLMDIWDDNCAELFFASQATDKLVHIGINDLGQAVLHDPETNKFAMAGDEVKTDVKRTSYGWLLTVSVANSLTGFAKDATMDCFNITRSRNVAKLLVEYSTYNPECFTNRWTSPQYYSIIKRVAMRNDKLGYSGLALPATEAAGRVLVEDAVAAGVNWSSWVPSASRGKCTRDQNVKHGEGMSYLVDCSRDDYSEKDKTCSWRCEFACPPAGTRMRVTAWAMVNSTVPDAMIALNVNWLKADHAWYTKQDLAGRFLVKAENGVWQKLQMEIVVPDVAEIKYFSPSATGVHAYPGKFWTGELKIEVLDK